MTDEEGSAILGGMEIEGTEHNEAAPTVWAQLPIRRIEPKRQGLSQHRAQLWALVLLSRYLEARVEYGESGWQVLVPEQDLETACRELRLFIVENRDWPPLPPPARPLAQNGLATVSVLILLATFHNIATLDLSDYDLPPVDWVALGNAHASLILRGEWWRTVTALTLHADWLHLLSNVAIGGIFVIFLCQELGSGLAWSLLLLCGALGNLANAYVQLPSHSSVGASTAVFAAVGLLGALGVIRYRHSLRRRWPLPVAAALALLALLGTEGKQTDLGAHLFGFLFGAVVGLPVEYLVGRFGRPGRLFNALLACLSAAVLVAAWWAALHAT